MKLRSTLIAIAAAASAACQIKPVAEHPIPAQTVAQSPVDAASPAPQEDQGASKGPSINQEEPNNVPPCLPEAIKPKAVAKRKPRPVPDADKPVPVEAPPVRVSASIPEVKPIERSVASILGKKVEDSGGEDLGRVVDVQADGTGRVRLVIIEFGGFLGVGNRRAAIDWSLLRFHPDDPDRPLSLSVTAKQILSTPEYRQGSNPRALMAPSPMPAVAPPQNK